MTENLKGLWVVEDLLYTQRYSGLPKNQIHKKTKVVQKTFNFVISSLSLKV